MNIELKDKYYIVINKIKSTFFFLEELNYITSLEQDGKNIEVLYDNDNLNREITVSYYPFNMEGKVFDAFSIYLTKLPYNNIGDFMVFEKYLSKHKLEFTDEYSKLSYYEGAFDNRVEKLLENLANDLKRYGWDIINGEKWERGYYSEW